MALSTEDVSTILKHYLGEKKFKFVSCEKVENEGYVPIGFLSAQAKFCIRYESEGRREELHIFVKMMPESQYHRETLIMMKGFTKEVEIFEKFLIDIKKKLEGTPIPTCYLARDNDLLVLDDVSYKGFGNAPLLESFGVQHCEKAIESLAKLQTSALSFEQKHKCKIAEHIPILKEETILSKDKNHPGYKAVQAGVQTLRELSNEYMPDYSDKVRNQVFDYMSNLHELLGPSLKYPNVFSHCDLWSNNLMFSYDEDGNVRECCIVDFQLATVKPLTYDLQMLLYICTDKNIRDKFYDHLVKHYYDSLSSDLMKENVDLSKLLPWKEYEDLLQETHPILLVLAPQYLHFVLMPDYIIRDVLKDGAKWKSYYEENRKQYVFKAAHEVPAYKSRVINSLTEAFEYFKNQNPEN